MINQERLDAANKILETIPCSTKPKMVVKANRVALSYWASWYNKQITKVWTPQRKGSHYPSWQTPWGGTHTTAINQLVRWVQDKPVFGIGVFKYWASEKLCNQSTIDLMESLGYPSQSICVLCKKPCKGLDWWSLGDLSGPCCSFGQCEDDCKAERNNQRANNVL